MQLSGFGASEPTGPSCNNALLRLHLRAILVALAERDGPFAVANGQQPTATAATMSTGEGLGTGFATARGRDYPSIRQFTVFLENRVGQLMEVVRRFEGSNVRIVALTTSDSTDCSLVRFLLSDPEAGREILERAGLAIVESDLIGVELPTSPQPLLQVCTALLAAEINITQVYPLLVRKGRNPAVALMVDNIEHALETLESKKFHTINEDELREWEPE